MRLIDEHNALSYLREMGQLPPEGTARAEYLSGGVSNIVLRIHPPAGQPDFILKQVREQLRTPDPWFSQPERIFNEIGVLQVLTTLLPAGAVPRVLWEDRDNFLFLMEAVDPLHQVWKQQLLRGEVKIEIGRHLGQILARIHRGTLQSPELLDRFGDLRMFDELRVDPYYRRLWRDHAAFREPLQRLIDHSLRLRQALVLADFSPKNILVHSAGVTLVDFETGHYGDPAFDLGFFLSHLFLKTVYHGGRLPVMPQLIREFLTAYSAELGDTADFEDEQGTTLEQRGIQHLAGCLWSRIDGTSRVDYLTQPGQQALVRRLSQRWLTEPVVTWNAALTDLETLLQTYPEQTN